MNSSPSQTDLGLQPTPSTSRSIAFFLFVVAVLEIVVCLRMPKDWLSEWDRATSMVVTNSVWRKATQGMSAPLADSHAADKHHDLAWNGAPLDQHYLKQFGGETFVLAAFAPTESERMERYLLSSRYVTATLSIIIVAALSTVLMRRCGLTTGLVLAAFLSFDHAFLSFTSFLRSLYWLPGLSLMPLMIMLALYDPTASTARRRWTLALFGFAVCLRALCGYEYISVPVLTACAAIFFQAPDKKLKVVLRDCAAFVGAGGIGAAVAIASHAVSLYCMFGSWEKAFQNTLGNAFRRSYGEHETVREMGSPEAYRRGVFGMLADNKPLTVLVGLWFVAILGYALLNRRKRRPPRPNYDTRLKALAAASLAGFAASCSWLALMRNHTAHHPQYNSLAFYQGFIWFAIPFIVVFAAGSWDEFRSAAAKE